VPHCNVCHHPSRAEIARGLLNGVSYRALATQYGLSPSALSRHSRQLKQQLALQEHRGVQTGFLEQL
jgi:transposase-like protein